MTQLTLNKIGLPNLPLRCPHCFEVHTTKVPHTQAYLTRCQHCKKLMVAKVISAKQPNCFTLRLAVEAVQGADFYE